MKWKKCIFGCLLFVLIERFCYFQTGTFSLSKMLHISSPPSPASLASSIELQQPLRFIGAGKQFYAFETADKKYVVKFLKWSRRRPIPWLVKGLEKLPTSFQMWKTAYLATRQDRIHFLQRSTSIALHQLSKETQLVIPKPATTFTLIDNLGIAHTIESSSTHFYVQHKAFNFTSYFEAYPSKARSLLQSFIHTVAEQCRQGICNLDPVIDRNYGVVDDRVILMDIGSFLPSSKLCCLAAMHQEILLELLPLRAWLQKYHPNHLGTFDRLLSDQLSLP